MNELSRHIETLLLENDCVIVPALGGFVAHYTSATYIEEENTFYPPVRSIGFNPQLKLNDGLMVQSYMSLYDLNFPEAEKKVNADVYELIECLHANGCFEIANIGELRYTIHDNYEFMPYNHKISTPYLYGLDAMKLSELSQTNNTKDAGMDENTTDTSDEEKQSHVIRTVWSTVAAAAATIALFFILSTPMKDKLLDKSTYAAINPTELIKDLLGNNNKDVKSSDTKRAIQEYNPKATLPDKAKTKSVAEKEKSTSTTTEEKPYHLIVASHITFANAKRLVKELKENGYSDAEVLKGKKIIRVSILACNTQDEANKEAQKIRNKSKYKEVWVK